MIIKNKSPWQLESLINILLLILFAQPKINIEVNSFPQHLYLYLGLTNDISLKLLAITVCLPSLSTCKLKVIKFPHFYFSTTGEFIKLQKT